MADVVAKAMAVIVAALLGIAIAAMYVTSRPPSGTQQVVAEFRNAFPLIEGMHVRVGGAIAGSVGKIEVNDEGVASVTLLVENSVEAPSADASAAIRQADTTGDSYVAYEPGDGEGELPEVDGKPTIECNAERATDPCANTLVAPRFDDLMNAFGPAQRAGLKLILVELSRALDNRGADLNQAALELRPALVATNQALAEVNSQNRALKSLIVNASDVTGQAASRTRELDGLIDGLSRVLDTTAAESGALDAGIEELPETLDEAQTLLIALHGAAIAGEPLATNLASAAPDLGTALTLAPPFLDDVSAVIERSSPTLELTRRLAVAGAPTIAADNERVVTGPFDLAPAVSNLFKGLFGTKETFDAFFGDDSDGVGPGTLHKRGFAGISVEPGNQPGYPASYADRNWGRVSLVLNCEAFGLEVKPGCLGSLLASSRLSGGGGNGGDEGSGGGGADTSTAEPPSPPSDQGDSPADNEAPELDLTDPLGSLDESLESLDGTLEDLGIRRPGRSEPGLGTLLDFLLDG